MFNGEIMRVRSKSGFTLVEIMIVVAIISLLTVIGVPGFVKARENARATRVANNLRKFGDSFLMYCIENGKYPVDTHNTLPPGMEGYIQQSVWDSDALGGHYNWEGPTFGEGGGYNYAGIALWETQGSQGELEKIDRILDNGDLASGSFLLCGNGRYTYIIEGEE